MELGPIRPYERKAFTPKKHSTAMLTLLALGVVYGDIGTSPLYAVKETFHPQYGIPLIAENILGGLSTIFWALILVVSLKYVTLVLRANNHGEGGIMALLALATSAIREKPRLRKLLTILGVFGASLFYGDAVITPAISVLSAVEGLEVATETFSPYVVPIAATILITLFLIQKHGTGLVGLLFGPICAVWFLTLGIVGIWNIAKYPMILQAVNPLYALHFSTAHGYASLVVLSAVLLAITGAEALYADMGHLGKKPIRVAWFGMVAPALVLNYFGQGALLILDPHAIENPFYLSFPDWALYPMISLATTACIIASQATISGAYSVTRQAIQLGYLPRLSVLHTSSKNSGQIYIPLVNWILLITVISVVIGFGSSSKLAAAYGIAVVGTMSVTTFLTFFVVRYAWKYPLWLCILATGFFMTIDSIFFVAAMHKVLDGGWFPLLLASAIFSIMMTWRYGLDTLRENLRISSIPLATFLKLLFLSPPHRIRGTAVFLTATVNATPSALLHSLKHYKVLHKRNIFLTVTFKDVPLIPFEEQVSCEKMGHDCWRVIISYGFMDRPNVAEALHLCERYGLTIDPDEISYFLSREKIISPTDNQGIIAWRDKLFATLVRNSASIIDFLNIPPEKVVELGTRVEL